MPHYRSPLGWTLIFAVAVLALVRPLPADDQTIVPPDGYKVVNVGSGGRSIPVLVRQQKDPLANVSGGDPNGKYDPERIFSRTSLMANKSFSDSSSTSAAASAADRTTSGQNSFVTKPYALDANSSSMLNLNAKPSVTDTQVYTQGNAAYDKSYPTSAADVAQNQSSALTSATAPEEGRTAVLGGQTTTTFASSLSDQTFKGEEADAAKRRLTRLKSGQMLVEDLPDRPLTVDEVRELLNHGFKPDTDVKPTAAPSKPLNDPAYQPEPIRVTPPPAGPVSDDDKDDPVPPPGTMAQPPPENSQPLPQP